MALARCIRVFCGSGTVSWEQIHRLVSTMFRHGLMGLIESEGRLRPVLDGIGNGINYLEDIRQEVQYFTIENMGEGISLVTLMDVLRAKNATNPVDKVYGILGLLSHEAQEAIRIDITLPPAKVFMEFARYWIERDFQLTLLSNTAQSKRLEGLASWCPNFDSERSTYSLGEYADLCEYEAGFERPRNFECQIKLISNTDTIIVPGLNVDEITETVDLKCPDELTKKTTDAVFEWEARCHALARRAYNIKELENMPDAFWRTLIGNRYIDEESNARKCQQELQNEYTEWHSATQAWAYNKPYHISPALLEYFNLVHVTCYGRRFFTTNGGMIGLGPIDIKAGDRVGIFYGGPTPYIIREEETSMDMTSDCFVEDIDKVACRLVGEAYVHGLMYGEAIEMRDQGIMKTANLIIR